MSRPDAAEEHRRRWRLILGQHAEEPLSQDARGQCLPSHGDRQVDEVLEQLYGDQRGSLQGSAPKVHRWLGDIRKYFPRSVVQLMQKDALETLGLERLLLEPETLEQLEPDVHLVGTLMNLSRVMPNRTRATARQVVRQVVDALVKRLQEPTRQAVRQALDRSQRNLRPRHNEIDWLRTIRANLKHYQPEYKTIIPERLIGFGRQNRRGAKRIVMAVDQSGSMASSVVYSAIFGAVLASIPSLATRMVVFDTEVVDLTEELDDPVDILFATQLGGGTDIAHAVAYCQERIDAPQETTLILITDLHEGGSETDLLRRTRQILASGANMVVLLALSDDGAPYYSHSLAGKMATLGVPSFACTPDRFPDLMGAALSRQDLARWASDNDLVTSRKED